MTHRLDVERGRDIAARWCNLAEQRLEYLTELFETGRWRRFHSELAILENIREAESAVEIWRDLSMREASRDNSAVDMSWLGHTRTTLPWVERAREQDRRLQRQAAEMPNQPSATVIPIVPKTHSLRSEQASSAPAMDDVSELTPDMTVMAERHPLLRTAL
jgi:uncharacterized repeat protein (TIGR03809 family)